MGWSYCGTDSDSRDIGYSIDATCDHKGCNKKIDRGLAYACGGMHGQNEYDCEKYFCYEHLILHTTESIFVCPECFNREEEA